jgi:hypothetical protein
MPEEPGQPQPIIFDFRTRRVYQESEADQGMMSELKRALAEVRAIQKRIVMTVGGTPPPKTEK